MLDALNMMSEAISPVNVGTKAEIWTTTDTIKANISMLLFL
jgi:hypothetical protein